jgi:hypothetical protein
MARQCGTPCLTADELARLIQQLERRYLPFRLPAQGGGIPTLDRGGVVAALASEAGSSVVAERLRTSARQGAQRLPGGKRPGPPPIPS